MSFLAIKSAGPADILDMVLVAALVYALLLWFKEAKSAFVAMGLMMLSGVYLMARLLGMYMTTWILKGFFGILVIAVVVIFQEEMRSIFERIAIWSLGGPHPKAGEAARMTEILVRSLGKFAREKVGALVVLRGKDPLDRHVEGGWDLDGHLSEALLESIFDSHSLGHDGAVIVVNGRVTRFGCHLPLSKEFGTVTNLGTRHTAALGLAELCDALCLVVSEEKGTISWARNGKIQPFADLKAMEDVVRAFFADVSPRPAQDVATRFFGHNLREKLIAATFSMALWLFFAGLRVLQR